MLGTNIPKSICFKLQIWVSHYFLVGRVKNTCSKIHLFQITNNGVSLFLGWLLSLFPTQIYILKNVSPTWRAHKNYPTYIHPPTVGMKYLLTKKSQNCWLHISIILNICVHTCLFWVSTILNSFSLSTICCNLHNTFTFTLSMVDHGLNGHPNKIPTHISLKWSYIYFWYWKCI